MVPTTPSVSIAASPTAGRQTLSRTRTRSLSPLTPNIVLGVIRNSALVQVRWEVTDEKNYICSITGFRCSCEPGRGCSGTDRGPRLDPPSAAALLLVKAGRVAIESTISIFEEAMKAIPFDRAYPKPEIRHVIRKLKTALALVEDIV